MLSFIGSGDFHIRIKSTSLIVHIHRTITKYRVCNIRRYRRLLASRGDFYRPCLKFFRFLWRQWLFPLVASFTSKISDYRLPFSYHFRVPAVTLVDARLATKSLSFPIVLHLSQDTCNLACNQVPVGLHKLKVAN